MDRKQKIRMAELLVIIVIGTFLEFLGVTAILPFINVIMNPESVMEKSYFRVVYDFFGCQNTNQFLIILAVVLILIYVVKNIYVSGMYKIQYNFTYNNQKRLTCKLMNGYINQEYKYFLSVNTAELLRKIGTDTGMFFAAVLSVLQLLTEGFVGLTLFFYLFYLDKSITIGVSIMLLGFILVFFKVFKKKIRILGEESRKAQSDSAKWMMQSFGGIKETIILGRQTFFEKKLEKIYEDFSINQQQYMFYLVFPRPLMETVCISGLLGVVALKLFRGVEISYFIPTISVFAVAAFRLLPSFNRITQYIGTLSFNISAVESVYNDMVEMDELRKNSEKDETESNAIINFNKNISGTNIDFAYQKDLQNVLSNIEFNIPQNSAVAFVGPSGAGKTTLVDLILGLLKPTAGEIKVDGVNINENVKSWRKKIGYIPQTIYLLDDTIKNNIAYGLDDEEIDMDRLNNAIKEAQLSGVIKALPEGLETIIGERGVRLSGGQRQRIGIARALYINPEVLVLDEATSALDSDTETAIMDAINSLLGKKTLIIIAHRLSTIEKCEIIYEIKEKGVLRIK